MTKHNRLRFSVKKSFLFTLAAMTVMSTLSTFFTSPAQANSALGFIPGHIMSDSVMRQKSSMNTTQIQSFLNSKGVNCTSGSNCLKNYKQNGKTAAQIIHEVSQEFSINPRVLIVLLQKEVGLVTMHNPESWRYRTATGYGCPDSTPGVCDTRYYGFTNQLRWSATMFDAILRNSPTWYAPYVVGANDILYHPHNNCGTKRVNIQNRATAALYSYTPYVPNQAAINAGYGTGNSCSSYGNRNFYLYFTDWFGSTGNQTLKVTAYDNTTDQSGEMARIGFSLSSKPTHSVTISYAVSSPSNAELVRSTGKLVISPNNWNNPSANTIVVRGKNNTSLKGTFEYQLVPTAGLSSQDKRFSSIVASALPKVDLLQQLANNRHVYRLYSETTQKHTFTASRLEYDSLVKEGWRGEGVRFSYCEAGDVTIARATNTTTGEHRFVQATSSNISSISQLGFSDISLDLSGSTYGDVPVYWRYDATNQRSIYTTNPNEATGSPWQDMGIAFTTCSNDSQPVFRLYRPSNTSHFYTTSRSERNSIVSSGQYRYEGNGFYTCANGSSPVYRLYRRSNNAHFYTSSNTERQSIMKNQYRDEGVKFYLCNDASRNVYRLYRSNTLSHFYTTSSSERNSLSSSGLYRDEGLKLRAK